MDILAKILPSYCQGMQDVMVRSYSSIRIPDSGQSNIFLFKKNVDYFFKNYEYQTNREFGPVIYIFLKNVDYFLITKFQVFFTTNC